jgi:hypothetical protein
MKQNETVDRKITSASCENAILGISITANLHLVPEFTTWVATMRDPSGEITKWFMLMKSGRLITRMPSRPIPL